MILIPMALMSAVVLVCVVAQLVLPGVVESRLRDRLEQDLGPVKSLKVDTSPAVTMLWGDYGSISAHISQAKANALSDADLSALGAGNLKSVDRLNLEIDRMVLGQTNARDLDFQSHSGDFTLTAQIPTEVNAPLPARLSAGADGGLYATVSFLGRQVPVQITASGGDLVAVPVGLGFFGMLATQTLLHRQTVELDGLTAVDQPNGITIRASGRIRA